MKTRKASFNGSASNIERVLLSATSAEFDAGMAWYDKAHVDARTNVDDNPVVAAGAVAAVSPGLRWERNIEAAARIARGQDLTGLGVRWYDGVRKAERIVRGESPLSVLRGNKVRAFYACIANPRNDYAVCVDGHAFSIWHGRRVNLDQTPNLTNKRYARIVRAYRKVAKKHNLLPLQVQAITWVVWRRMHLDNGQLRLNYV